METEWTDEVHKEDTHLRCGRGAASAALPVVGGMMVIGSIVFALGAVAGAGRAASHASALTSAATLPAIPVATPAAPASLVSVMLVAVPLVLFAVFAATLVFGGLYVLRDAGHPLRRRSLAANLRRIGHGAHAAADKLENGDEVVS